MGCGGLGWRREGGGGMDPDLETYSDDSCFNIFDVAGRQRRQVLVQCGHEVGLHVSVLLIRGFQVYNLQIFTRKVR